MSVRIFLSTVYSYTSDMARFIKAAHLTRPDKTHRTAQAHILRISHSLEKGMALPQPKPGFGDAKMMDLAQFIGLSCDRWGVGEVERIGYNSIREALAFHAAKGCDMPHVRSRLDALLQAHSALGKKVDAGTLRLTKAEIMAARPPSPAAFFKTRKSVRQFAERQTFDPGILDEALRLAQYTPSVCNRQTARAYAFTEPSMIDRLLAYQDGNRGFGSSASAVLVVTSDMAGFYKVGERNQGYVDGGLFAMSIVYALHALGVGTCMLNWSQSAHKDAQFRKAIGLGDDEIVITMIAAGPLLEEFPVAFSPRRALDSIYQLNPQLPLKGGAA